MKLVGYLRVSSESQLDGFGLDAQESAIRSWSSAHGHKLSALVRDAGVSGATDAFDRPGLTDVLQRVIDGRADGLLVARLDRLARSLSVQEATLAIVWRSGREVFTADQGLVLRDDVDDPLRTALRQVVGVFSELERRLVTKRLKDGRAAKVALGRKATGSYPYGYGGQGRGRHRDATPIPAEQLVIQMIVHFRDQGLSYRQIVKALSDRGVQPRRATAWSPMTVRAIARREQSLGVRGLSGPSATSQHERVVAMIKEATLGSSR